MRRALSLVALWLAVAPAGVAETYRLEIFTPAEERPTSRVFQLPGTGGFSVSWMAANKYRVFGSSAVDVVRWNDSTSSVTSFYYDRGHAIDCRPTVDPRFWDRRCIESLGIFEKYLSCSAGSPCEYEGTWNALPGQANVATTPVSWLWPRHDDWRTNGYVPVLDKDKVNATLLQPQASSCQGGAWPCPPKTGAEAVCFPANPDAYATGASNGKAVEIYWNEGIRWFMAFNKQLRKDGPPNADDKWQMLWAISEDGLTWRVHEQVLLRTVKERATTRGECAGGGPVVLNMFNAENHYYVLFTDTREHPRKIYMMRAVLEPWLDAGYSAWYIAATPVVNGRWTWKRLTLGAQVDLRAMNAADVMPCPDCTSQYFVRQAAVTRVFTSTQPNSPSRFIGLASGYGQAGPRVMVYSSTLPDRPFVRHGDVDMTHIKPGAFGIELGFTNYPDNLPWRPRVTANALDIWFSEDRYPIPGVDAPLMRLTLSRHTARVKGGIFGE